MGLGHSSDRERGRRLAQRASFFLGLGEQELPGAHHAFAKALLGVRDETPAFIDDLLGDSGLFTELGKALPAMLYEYLTEKQSHG